MLELAGIAVDAVSVGGLETCIQLPGYGLAFDIGRCPRGAVPREHVLFTHAHIDHLGGIVQHAATRSLLGMSPPTYVLPAHLVEDVDALFQVWRRLDRSDLPCRLVPLSPGERLPLKKDVAVRPFRSLHRVFCQGYTIYRARKRLRPDLVGLTSDEVRLRRMAGEDVSVVDDVPEVAFTGDTLIDVVDREPELRRARLLILEVTFLDERVSVAQTRAKGHVHLDEVVARADLFENDALLFTHLSARYSAAEAEAILDRRLPRSLRERVTLLRPPDEVWRS